MAATAAIGSSFSPSLHALKCTQITQYSSDSLKISAPFRITLPPLSCSSGIEPASAPWRVMHRVRAAVAQEETAVAESVEEEQVVSVEVEGEGGDEASEVVATKLYFKNLPYNVDSAQLAAIIQDYGTPELVEAFHLQFRLF